MERKENRTENCKIIFIRIQDIFEKKEFNGIATELKELTFYVLLEFINSRMDYSKIINFFDKILDNKKYGSGEKLDWEGLSGLKTSFNTLETIKFKDFEVPSTMNLLLAWIKKILRNILVCK